MLIILKVLFFEFVNMKSHQYAVFCAGFGFFSFSVRSGFGGRVADRDWGTTGQCTVTGITGRTAPGFLYCRLVDWSHNPTVCRTVV